MADALPSGSGPAVIRKKPKPLLGIEPVDKNKPKPKSAFSERFRDVMLLGHVIFVRGVSEREVDDYDAIVYLGILCGVITMGALMVVIGCAVMSINNFYYFPLMFGGMTNLVMVLLSLVITASLGILTGLCGGCCALKMRRTNYANKHDLSVIRPYTNGCLLCYTFLALFMALGMFGAMIGVAYLRGNWHRANGQYFVEHAKLYWQLPNETSPIIPAATTESPATDTTQITTTATEPAEEVRTHITVIFKEILATNWRNLFGLPLDERPKFGAENATQSIAQINYIQQYYHCCGTTYEPSDVIHSKKTPPPPSGNKDPPERKMVDWPTEHWATEEVHRDMFNLSKPEKLYYAAEQTSTAIHKRIYCPHELMISPNHRPPVDVDLPREYRRQTQRMPWSCCAMGMNRACYVYAIDKPKTSNITEMGMFSQDCVKTMDFWTMVTLIAPLGCMFTLASGSLFVSALTAQVIRITLNHMANDYGIDMENMDKSQTSTKPSTSKPSVSKTSTSKPSIKPLKKGPKQE